MGRPDPSPGALISLSGELRENSHFPESLLYWNASPVLHPHRLRIEPHRTYLESFVMCRKQKNYFQWNGSLQKVLRKRLHSASWYRLLLALWLAVCLTSTTRKFDSFLHSLRRISWALHICVHLGGEAQWGRAITGLCELGDDISVTEARCWESA